MGEARGHHYISQCYLKRFTRNGSKKSNLWVCDLKNGHSFSTAPANVAKERDFNRIEGLPPGELDNRLGMFETEADKALDTIEQARTLDGSDAWLHVLNLAALFAVRTPRMREHVREFHERVARMMMDLTLAKPERWGSSVQQARAAGHLHADNNVTYEQVKAFHERGEYKVNVSTAHHIGLEFHVFEPVLRTLAGRKWTLYVAEADSGGFITTDNPVCLMNTDGAPPTLMRPIGHGLTGTTVLFPITRHLLAAGAYEGGEGVHIVGREFVANLNALVLAHADKYVFAADDRFFLWRGSGARACRGGDLPGLIQEQMRKTKGKARHR
jgi:hypothetical protein